MIILFVETKITSFKMKKLKKVNQNTIGNLRMKPICDVIVIHITTKIHKFLVNKLVLNIKCSKNHFIYL